MNKLETKSKKEEKNHEFKIYVTYDKNGKSFQEVAENILLRKINED